MSGLLPLRIEGLAYALGGLTLLGPLDATLGSSGITIVLGPNGAGKSLFLRLLHGLLEPSAGRVAWNGLAPAAARARQAMVFQRPILLRRSALANVTYALALKGVPRRQRRDQAAAALEAAGLSALAARPARVLSGGEQQRLALARAAATEPEVLLLDEPTASLDPGATRQIEEAIRSLAQAGRKILMSTHDLGQARRLADEVLYLDRGRLLEQAPAGRFFAGPHNTAAAAFLAGELIWERGEAS